VHAREKNQTAGRSLNKTCSKDAKENNFQHEDRGAVQGWETMQEPPKVEIAVT